MTEGHFTRPQDFVTEERKEGEKSYEGTESKEAKNEGTNEA